MGIYTEQSGNRNQVLACDGEAVLSELSKGKFLVSTNASTYSNEIYTSSYIKSIFNALTKIENFWGECKVHVGEYIKTFEDVSDPNDIVDSDTTFLDQVIGTGKVKTQSGRLNIRKEPGTSSDIIGKLSTDSTIEILGYSDDGKWIKIKTVDGIGFVFNKYVTSISNLTSMTEVNENIYGIVSTELQNLNVRSMPTTDSSVLDTLEKGQIVDIKGLTEDQNWYEVQLSNGQKGYVSKDYITLNNEVESKTPVVSASIGYIDTNTGNLNVRSNASANSSILTSLPKGEKVTILDYPKNSNWVKISYKGEEAYIYKDYVKREGE